MPREYPLQVYTGARKQRYPVGGIHFDAQVGNKTFGPAQRYYTGAREGQLVIFFFP